MPKQSFPPPPPPPPRSSPSPLPVLSFSTHADRESQQNHQKSTMITHEAVIETSSAVSDQKETAAYGQREGGLPSRGSGSEDVLTGLATKLAASAIEDRMQRGSSGQGSVSSEEHEILRNMVGSLLEDRDTEAAKVRLTSVCTRACTSETRAEQPVDGTMLLLLLSPLLLQQAKGLQAQVDKREAQLDHLEKSSALLSHKIEAAEERAKAVCLRCFAAPAP